MALRLDDTVVALYQFTGNPRPTAAQLANFAQTVDNRFQQLILQFCAQHNIELTRDQLSLVTLLAFFSPGATAPLQVRNAVTVFMHVSTTAGQLRPLTIAPSVAPAASIAPSATELRVATRAASASARRERKSFEDALRGASTAVPRVERTEDIPTLSRRPVMSGKRARRPSKRRTVKAPSAR